MLLGPRDHHVEEAVLLLLLRFFLFGPQDSIAGRVEAPRAFLGVVKRNPEAPSPTEDLPGRPRPFRPSQVGQDHQRELQPFGRVNGHQLHRVVAGRLDRGFRFADLGRAVILEDLHRFREGRLSLLFPGADQLDELPQVGETPPAVEVEERAEEPSSDRERTDSRETQSGPWPFRDRSRRNSSRNRRSFRRPFSEGPPESESIRSARLHRFPPGPLRESR